MKLTWPFGTMRIVTSLEIPPSLKRKDLNDAQKIYEAVVSSPGDISLRTLYAGALAQQGQLQEAITEYREVLSLIANAAEPRASGLVQQEAFVHLSLGESLNRIGQQAEARAEWEATIRLDPSGAGRAAQGMLNAQR